VLTCDEILDILRRDHKIEITVRTFNYYKDNGLIPPVQGRRNRKGLYPDSTPALIASIKNYQKDGMRLSDIKKLMRAIREKKLIEKQRSEDEKNYRYFKSWSDPKETKRRLITFLNLEDRGQKYDVGMIGGLKSGIIFAFISVFYDEFIDFYQIQIDFEKPGEKKILNKKRLTPDRYRLIALSMLDSNLRLGKLIDKDDIFIHLFY
jgi:DNA-binding transcriptional MerR regulator